MSIEVDFITLGDVAERLSTPENRVPAPTLRHWTDQLEEFEVHYILRNNRNERIYEASDIKVFEYLRDLKAEFGRKTTTRDLSRMIAEKGRQGELQLRTREDSPIPEPINRTTDILNQEDIRRVLESDRARQVIGYLVSEATNNLKEQLVEEVRQTVREEILENKTHTQLVLEELEKKRIQRELEREKREEERLAKMEENTKLREERTDRLISEWREQQKERQREKEEELKAKEEEAQKPKSWLQKLLGQ